MKKNLNEIFYHSGTATIMANLFVDKDGCVSQKVSLRVEGEGVLYLPQHANSEREASGYFLDYACHFIDAFMLCANNEMFICKSHQSNQSEIKLVDEKFDINTPNHEWVFDCKGINIGAFRTLTNFFSIQGMDKVSLQPSTIKAGTLLTKILEQSYPSYQPLPFMVEKDPDSSFGSKNRGIQIIFTHELNSKSVEMVIEIIEAWSTIIMYCGFSPSDVLTENGGGFPDVAYQMDSHTIEQSFTEYFMVDNAAFYSLVNGLNKIHKSGLLIEKVFLY